MIERPVHDRHEGPSCDERLRWRASKFNHVTADADGSHLLYNAAVGALARIPAHDADSVAEAARRGFSGLPTGLLAELALNGFFVPDGADEDADALLAQRTRYDATDALELILLPNENCNFRCVYCYETFARGKMSREVIEGVVALVKRRAPRLAGLRIGWFGGEPLTAPKVIDEVSTRLQEIAREYGIDYSSSMVTNGYFLSPSMAEMLFRAEVRQFQITIDGPQEEHDRLRVLADGTTGTFERIMTNLKALGASEDAFQVVLRVNFDADSKGKVDVLLEELDVHFGRDPRFTVDFHPIGQWGGPNDTKLNVCGVEDGRQFRNRLFAKSSEGGMNLKAMRQRLAPFGSVCYAANPHSFVIGSDGTVYKCTVAFEDPRNHVGRLSAQGDLVLDNDRLQQWTSGGADSDTGCQACFFRPACQGNACPLERITTGKRPCPSTKLEIDDTLRVLAADADRTVDLGLPSMPTRT